MQHKDGSKAQFFWSAMAKISHTLVAMRGTLTNSDDILFAHKDSRSAITNGVFGQLGGSYHHEHTIITIAFNFGALMLSESIFNGKFVQVKCLLNFSNGFDTWVVQSYPNKYVVVG